MRVKLKNQFLPQFRRQWQSVSRKQDKFKIKYHSYMKKNFVLKCSEGSSVTSDMMLPHPKYDPTQVNTTCGRLKKPYDDASPVVKRRRINDLASQYSSEELAKALKKKNHQLINDQTLAMYVDIQLSKGKYIHLNTHLKKIFGAPLLSSYESLAETKKLCYPDNIEVTESGAEVHFISLLDHTTRRLLLQLDQTMLKNIQGKKLLLIGKWGMDGASGQQTTRQKWSHDNDTLDISNINEQEDSIILSDYEDVENRLDIKKTDHKSKEKHDQSVFIICFSPLQLKADDEIIWFNDAPNSVETCRTIKFEFTKETDVYVMEHYRFYTRLLNKVKSYCIQIEDQLFEITFDIRCTMIDGKVCNVLTEQKATNSCNICRASPKLINNLDYVKNLPCSQQYLQFGLSSLHCRIRCMEYILKLSYNLEFKKPSARDVKDKESKKLRKKEVQSLLKSKLSLTVDVVKQGAGTTNTGNVAREFFANAQKVAECTNIDEELIIRLNNILQVVTCKKAIDPDAFEKYCWETAELCIALYGWYKMPPTIHKLLIHGASIIRYFHDIPLGWLSEEPQEGNNKIFRRLRLQNSRMSSRELTNTDIMRYQMILSDPLISSLRIKEPNKEKALTEAAKGLLIDSR